MSNRVLTFRLQPVVFVCITSSISWLRFAFLCFFGTHSSFFFLSRKYGQPQTLPRPLPTPPSPFSARAASPWVTSCPTVHFDPSPLKSTPLTFAFLACQLSASPKSQSLNVGRISSALFSPNAKNGGKTKPASKKSQNRPARKIQNQKPKTKNQKPCCKGEDTCLFPSHHSERHHTHKHTETHTHTKPHLDSVASSPRTRHAPSWTPQERKKKTGSLQPTLIDGPSHQAPTPERALRLS